MSVVYPPPSADDARVVRYALVALIGMLAGFVVGGVFGPAACTATRSLGESKPVAHPRAIEPTR